MKKKYFREKLYTNDEVAKLILKSINVGIRWAAEIADDYNSSSTHPYMLGDCIMAKLNKLPRKPRKNPVRLFRVSR